MRCWIALWAAALLTLPSLASAARIEGQVLSHAGGELEAPVDVLLFSFDESGRHENETKTDKAGNFAFPDLKAPGFYWVSLRHEGIMYPGRTVELQAADQNQTKQVSLAIYEKTAAGPAVTAEAMAVIVQPEDAGLFRVRQEVYVENPQPIVIERKPGSGVDPILRIGLAKGHENLQTALFPFLPLETTDKGGEIEVFGPIFPSSQVVTLEYGINTAASGRALDTELVLAQPMTEIRILLPPAQFELEVGGGMHNGPPERDQRTGSLRHQTFVGFNLPAGTRIPIKVTPRTAPQPPSTPITVLMITALFGLAAFVALQPVLVGLRRGRVAPADVPQTGEHDALFGALRDLEDDYELGKVSLEDRDRMREELRSEALRNMAIARQNTRTAGREGASPKRSGGGKACECGHRPEKGARFCSSCGRSIA